VHDAERMFAFPRLLGVHPETHSDVEVLFGPFGAYVRCGDDTRSLKSENDAFEIDLGAALELLATPKSYRGRRRGRKSGSK
jgi:DNA topoisomerase-1